MNPVAGALRRIDISDRKVVIGAAVAALVFATLWLAVGIASEQYSRVGIIFALVGAPFAIALALRRPLLFPYALYVLLIPFDNLLSLGSAGTLTRWLALVAGAALVVQILRTRRFVKPGRAIWLFWTFWAFAAVGVTWTPDVVLGVQFLQSLGQILILYGILAIAPLDERDLRMLLTTVVIGGVLAAIYGIVIFHDSNAVADDTGRLMVIVGDRMIDSNHFANALLAPLAIALVALIRARRVVVFVSALVAVALLGTTIVMTLSREAMLAVPIIIFVIIMFARRRLLAAAIAVPVMALIPLLVPSVAARMQNALLEHGGGRNYIWHVVWLAWQQHPWIGWGTGGAIAAYNANYLNVYLHVTEKWSRPPHNTYLHVAVDLGVVGLVLFGAALVAACSDVRRVARTHPLYDVRVMLTASLAALFFVASFIDLMDYKYLWVILALAAQYRIVVTRSATPSS